MARTRLSSSCFHKRYATKYIILFLALSCHVLAVSSESKSDEELVGRDTLVLADDNIVEDESVTAFAAHNLRNRLEFINIEEVEDLTRINDARFTWPWNSKNKTTDSACRVHQNCTSCTEASMACHWCSFDDQCHAKVSWHGCAIGATCPSNDTVDNSCKAHKSCADCALSSSLCHWCAFDDECHAIGSMYGCAHGVNCYSNDRCKREAPEKINEGIFDDIGFIPIFLICSAAFGSLCCFSVLFAGTSALKGAYDSLAQVDVPPDEAFGNHRHEYHNPPVHFSPLHEETDVFHEDAESEGNNEANALPDGNPSSGNNNTNNEDNAGNKESPTENDLTDNITQQQTTQDALTERLLPVTPHPDPSRLPSRNRSISRHVNCLMNSCKVWFIFSIIGVVLCASLGIIYFPKAPEYNVCSDEFAWTSIIKGLTSLKMEASFEILMSVKNENRLDVALEGFGGKFKHDGEDIGTFSLPRTIVEATSITDMLVTCTVVPDRWEALGLISDYWKGQLEFLVDVSGSVKIKGIGFSIPIKVSDVLVKVNDPDMDDRHLCACPQWKDLVPTASPKLTFEEAILDPVKFVVPTKQEEIEFSTS
jgi:hypothetical protein